MRLSHARGETRARFAVFCAGAWSDRLAVLNEGRLSPPMPAAKANAEELGLLMGGGSFALLFIGLQTASPSTVTVLIPSRVPTGIGAPASTSPASTRWRAKTRTPLPHISETEPSALR